MQTDESYIPPLNLKPPEGIDEVQIAIDRIRDIRHILISSFMEKEMDILAITQGVVRSLKKLNYDDKLQVLELARKAIDFEEKNPSPPATSKAPKVDSPAVETAAAEAPTVQ